MTTNTRAQIPGYCGYIPGKYSENKFGSTFGQVTKGSYGTQGEAFLTTNIANNTFIQRQHEDVRLALTIVQPVLGRQSQSHHLRKAHQVAEEAQPED